MYCYSNDFPFINIRKILRKVLKTEGECLIRAKVKYSFHYNTIIGSREIDCGLSEAAL